MQAHPFNPHSHKYLSPFEITLLWHTKLQDTNNHGLIPPFKLEQLKKIKWFVSIQYTL